ncbi:MAG: DsbA family protein, partial [Tepidiformaceae bacterium]
MARTTWQPSLVLPVSEGRDHMRGRVGAPVTLVEYGDFECPHCGAAYPVVEAIRERMSDAICFVFRHFPISTIHPHAEPAAEAAEAAGAQGRFWEMHHAIFARQDLLAAEDLVARAVALGLDAPRFETELLNHA